MKYPDFPLGIPFVRRPFYNKVYPTAAYSIIFVAVDSNHVTHSSSRKIFWKFLQKSKNAF